MNSVAMILFSNDIAGTELQVYSLLKGLKANNRYKLYVICSNESYMKMCNQIGVESYFIRVTNNHDVLAALYLYMLLRRLRPDIIHTHLGWANIIGKLVGKLLGIKIIISTEHVWCANNESFSYWRNKFHLYVYRCLSLITNKIIVVSKSVFNFLACNVGISEDKLIVISNTIIPKNYIERRKSNDIVAFGAIGRLEYEKGLDVLLNAIPILKGYDFKLYIVGDGSQKNKYIQMCKELNISDKVFFTGYVDNSEIEKIYEIIDVLVLPSRRETFGLVLLEAMQFGIPCIGSDVGGIPEIITDGKDGYLFTSGDYVDLANKMKSFISNKNLCSVMGKAARKKVVEKFDYEKMVKETENVYKNELFNLN